MNIKHYELTDDEIEYLLGMPTESSAATRFVVNLRIALEKRNGTFRPYTRR